MIQCFIKVEAALMKLSISNQLIW